MITGTYASLLALLLVILSFRVIALLDSSRHLLEELSPHLGVTDPVSGTVVFEV